MNFTLNIIFLIASWFPTILSYNLIFGKGKIFHFGPMGIFIVAVYSLVIVLMHTQSFALAYLSGVVGGMITAAFFAWLSFRLEPDGLGIMSIAVHLALIAIVRNWSDLTRGSLGIPGIPRPTFMGEPLTNMHLTVIMVCIALLWFAAMLWLDRTKFGRQMAALAEHQWHAKALGISRVRVHLIAFLISGVGAATVALMYAPYISLIHPNDYLYPTLVMYVIFVVAGKPGSVLGVSAAIILLVLLKEYLRFAPIDPNWSGPTELFLFGFILFGAVWIRRDSLFPQERSI